MQVTLFDLDHTLLGGDSDELWCEFLMRHGLLERAAFEPRNRRLVEAYRAGEVGVDEFCGFYVGTLAGRRPAEWDELRREFLRDWIAPRIPEAARRLVAQHGSTDELVLLTTATNRYITELTAAHLGFAHLLATECELDDGGRFTGRVQGVANMRAGKVERLQAWLTARGIGLDACESTAYSDSINDLPLLEAVRVPVVVDADPALAALARERGWTSLSIHGGR